MKKITFTLFIATAFIVQMTAQDNKEKSAVENKNAPVITFEKTVHDFGSIPKGGNGECEFVFKNTGKEPLTLTSVRASCGCTTPYWTQEPITKGKTGFVRVKYDTNRIGAFSKTITVTSNSSTNSTIVLTIKGVVEDVASVPAAPQNQ